MSTFRIQEFAKLAGVTVRALHHYDRLGLLSPSHRSESGYRLYCHDDLGKLERVLVLRYLGLPLREIGALLNSAQGKTPAPLSATLSRQYAVLRERRAGLDRVLRAVEHAQILAGNLSQPEWLIYQTIMKEIQMQETQNWTDRYYSPSALDTLKQRRAEMTLEAKFEIGVKWQALFADLQEVLDRGIPPDSPEGREVVARWMRLGDEFSGGDPQVGEGYRRLYDDESHWPDDEKAAELRANMPKAEYRKFFHAAVQACLRHG